MSSVLKNEENEENALLVLQKLKSQFGDLDLSGMLLEEQQTHTNSIDNDDDSDDSSSCLEDPTPEELEAWQAKQFQKGKEALELKKQLTAPSPVLQRRRELKNKMANYGGGGGDDEDDNEWEQVPALPDLKGQRSIFFPDKDDLVVNDDDDDFCEILGVHPLLQKLVQEGDPEILGTSWLKLYSSADGDGLSFYKLLDSIRSYPGPTVTLIGTVPSANHSLLKIKQQQQQKEQATGRTLGFYTTSGWTLPSTLSSSSPKSKSAASASSSSSSSESMMFGTSDCFLFALDEPNNQVKFFRPLPGKDKDEKKYMYCNPSSSYFNHNASAKYSRSTTTTTTTTKTDGYVHGIGFGGTPKQPRLHLTETFEDCRAMPHCSKFQDGDLLLIDDDDNNKNSNAYYEDCLYYFDVDCIEIWAVGGDDWIQESLETQRKEQSIATSTRLRAQKIHDKRPFMDDFRSGFSKATTATGGAALFDHVQHTVGRL